MVTAKDTLDPYPHIATCDEQGEREPYMPASGLAVWEIAMLARSYSDDTEFLARELYTEPHLIDEALRYAEEHREHIDQQIRLHTERPLEELLEMFPGMTIIDIPMSEPDRLRP